MNEKIFDEVMVFKDGEPIVPKNLRDWLVNNGFFIAPASTRYHGSHEGGLFEHSLAVTQMLVAMTEKKELMWQREASPFIIGMFHDLCKIDQYIPAYYTEAEQTQDGNRITMTTKAKWEYNQNTLIKGHGEKSVMLLSQFFTLTEEEIMCILYHMGAYNTDEWDEYDKAIRKYPNVLWTHTADMYASKVLNR